MVPSLAFVDIMYSMLSTPFICCSIGVATDCSIVRASAPVYVVDTLICGGTMSGSMATGSFDIATTPPSTVIIEMTIATMGRPIKNFDMATSHQSVGSLGYL